MVVFGSWLFVETNSVQSAFVAPSLAAYNAPMATTSSLPTVAPSQTVSRPGPSCSETARVMYMLQRARREAGLNGFRSGAVEIGSHVVGRYSPFPCLSRSLARYSPGLYPCHSAALGAPQSRRCWQLQAACSTCWLDASARYPVKRKYAFNLSTIDWRGASTHLSPSLASAPLVWVNVHAWLCACLQHSLIKATLAWNHPTLVHCHQNVPPVRSLFFSKGIRASPTIEGVHSVKEASLQPIPQQHPHTAVQMNQEVHPILRPTLQHACFVVTL